MADASIFDHYRVRRLLADQLGEHEQIERIATDDATGAYWVLTTCRVVLVRGDAVDTTLTRRHLAGEVEQSPDGLTIHLHDPESATVVATFRKPNKLTEALAGLLAGS